MNTASHIPSWAGVLASVILVLLAASVSWRSQLGMTRELLVAAVRAFVQLVAVGALLVVVFERGGLPAAFGWLVVMVFIAGLVAGRRASGVPNGQRLSMVAIAVAVATTMGVLLVFRVISTEPEVVIPVGGMVVSTAMASAALALRRVHESSVDHRIRVEAKLSLGLTARAAFADEQGGAVRTALIPAIDSTKVVGLISLPGAMTGLILAGVDPLDAIRYQIVVMYMLLAAASLSALLAARLGQRALFDDADRLLRPAMDRVG